MADEMFDSLNPNTSALEFLMGDSAEDLKNQITSIRLPTKIIAIYAVGSKHVAWIQTTAKIVKKVKGK
jgi:hypothetical protein